ncbi:MAG: helix-turn-helix domain-containing protein [Lachnospiraceae bacterium]|nr:helix-turn-helix domain-containing protein [Lachnospiraceae bacterium]
MRNLIYRNNIYELRTSLGISQERMAGDLNISRRSISKIECGEQNPSLEIVYRISAYFGRNIPEVFPLLAETHLVSCRGAEGERR